MNKTINTFKDSNSLEYRKNKFASIVKSKKAFNRLPVICVLEDGSTRFKGLNIMKFLCEKDMSMGMLLMTIRERLNQHENGLDKTEAIFLLIGDGNNMASSDEKIEDIYNKYKDDEDNFVYCIICVERTFG